MFHIKTSGKNAVGDLALASAWILSSIFVAILLFVSLIPAVTEWTAF
jgi:hypothetical protein